jgi:putative transcription factor
MKISCDICGRDDTFAVVLVEGAKMVACRGCTRGKKILHRLEEDEEGQVVELRTAKRGPMDSDEEIVEGYGKIIRKAREKTSLKIAVIAEKINEKESYLDAIENERLRPTIAVARKLERELGIKLIEKVQEEQVSSTSTKAGKFSEPTLADALLTQKKKEK